MSAGAAPGIGLELMQRIESHSVDAWPAQEVERWSDGWVLRATPGLPGRGRSNHALAPVQPIAPQDYDAALARAAVFAERHGIEFGLQVGPVDVHVELLTALQILEWDIQQSVCVMTARAESVAAGADPEFELTVTDNATDEWIAAWRVCEPGRSDVGDHVKTVFRYLQGAARFFAHGDSAVGISVERDGLVGLFCLAVDPELRRQGLGQKLVRGMLRDTEPDALAYLQVFGHNEAGVALYNSLGFIESYRYCHCIAPA